MRFRFLITVFGGGAIVGVSVGCPELPPSDLNGPLVMTVWVRPLIDQFNHPVPVGASHIPAAHRIWYRECYVSLHTRSLDPIDVRGLNERHEDGFPLGEQFFEDDINANIIRIQRRRVEVKHMDDLAELRGLLGTNLFYTKKILQNNKIQTAKGVTERGANATVLLSQDDEPYHVLIAAHELGHQLNLRHAEYPRYQEADKWVMHDDVYSTGPNLTGWERPENTAPDEGSECHEARQHGIQHFYLLLDPIITSPLPSQSP